MEIGIIGLGRMGANIARRLMRAGPRLRGLRPQPEGRGDGWRATAALPQRRRSKMWSRSSTAPRAIWLMLPSGAVTEEAVAEVAARLFAPATS